MSAPRFEEGALVWVLPPIGTPGGLRPGIVQSHAAEGFSWIYEVELSDPQSSATREVAEANLRERTV